MPGAGTGWGQGPANTPHSLAACEGQHQVGPPLSCMDSHPVLPPATAVTARGPGAALTSPTRSFGGLHSGWGQRLATHSLEPAAPPHVWWRRFTRSLPQGGLSLSLILSLSPVSPSLPPSPSCFYLCLPLSPCFRFYVSISLSLCVSVCLPLSLSPTPGLSAAVPVPSQGPALHGRLHSLSASFQSGASLGSLFR